MNAENVRSPSRPTGRKYESVGALMTGEGVSPEVQSKVAEIESETRVVLQLAWLRQKAGITQEEMAKHLNITQSAISKLESGRDEDLTLKEIKEYARATGQRIAVMFGKPLNHVEAVKAHAMCIKDRLELLAKIANQDQELEKEIQGFFGEAFFNILTILASCNGKLHNGVPEFDVRIEVLKSDSSARPVKLQSRDAIAA